MRVSVRSVRRAVSQDALVIGLLGLSLGALGTSATGAVQAAAPAFDDVPSSHWAYSYIMALAENGYIAGCAADPPRYCPEATTNRAEMAVFVERGDHGGGFQPSEPAQQVFADVLLNAWYAKWVTALWEDAYTAGCLMAPLSYCPEAGHTRAEATVFFVRLRLGKDYQPPAPTTMAYEDVPIGVTQPWYSKWVAAAAEQGIVQECEDDTNRGDRQFRPEEGLTRAEGACMLYLAKRAPAATYYVDNTCSISGNGLGQTCATTANGAGPFNSLSAAAEAVTGNQSDVSLLLKRGQTYPGPFSPRAYGTAGHPFTISAYGTGSRPRISGGSNNMRIGCAACRYIVVEGLELANAQNWGILILPPAEYVTIRNTYIHHAYSGVGIYGSSNNTIDANEISWNGSDGLKMSVGDPPYHPTSGNRISNNTVHHNMRYGILTQANYTYRLNGPGTEISGNEAYNNSTGIYLVYTDYADVHGNRLHDNGKDCQGTNDCSGEAYGFAIQSGSNNAFHDNIIARSKDTGIGVYGSQDDANSNSDGNRLYRNVVYGTILSEWKRDMAWQCWPGNSVGADNQIYNNLFFGDGDNFVIGDSNPSVSGNLAYNNIFYGGGNAVLFEGTYASAGWTFKNNIFAGSNTHAIVASRRGGLSLLNNLYYRATGGTLVYYNGTQYTASNIHALDSAAIVADPGFVGTQSWYDFRPGPASPAIDSGVNLGSPFNLTLAPHGTAWPPAVLDQNAYGSGWEIGAFVYDPGAAIDIGADALADQLTAQTLAH